MPGRTVKPYRLQVRVATAHAITLESTSDAADADTHAILDQTVVPPFLDGAAAAVATYATHLQK